MVLLLMFLYLMVLHHQYSFYLFPHLRFLVMERKLKVHTQMLAWPSPIKISYAYITFHFFHILCKPFQYLYEQYPTLHPTIDMYLFPPLTMPWVLLKTKYSASWIHYFLWRHYHNWNALLFGSPLEVSTTFH
jgi:hypothetical protein